MKIRDDILGNVFDKDIEICDDRGIEDGGWATLGPPSGPPATHPAPPKGADARVKRD